jgi:hypothetical protein
LVIGASLLDLQLELSDEVGQGHPNSPAEGTEFHNVDAALASLALANERLSLPEARSDLLLGEASGLASGS